MVFERAVCVAGPFDVGLVTRRKGGRRVSVPFINFGLKFNSTPLAVLMLGLNQQCFGHEWPSFAPCP